jgi:carboxylesterase
MAQLGKRLHAQNFSVTIPHISGYGAQRRAEDTPTKWEDWSARALHLLDDLSARYKSVSVVGLCIGAVMALHLAQKRPHQIRSLGLLSTTLFFDGWALPFQKILLPISRFIPLPAGLSFKEGYPFGVKNDRVREVIKAQMKRKGASIAGAAKTPLVAIREAYRFIKVVQKGIPTVSAPCLIVHALEDETASVKNAHYVFDTLRHQNKKILLLKASYHMITLDNEKELVAQEVAAFVASNCSANIEYNLPDRHSQLAQRSYQSNWLTA